MILLLNLMPCSVTSIFFTRSGSGGLRSAVLPVATRPPNSVISAVVPTGCGPRGLIEWMWTQSTSPFSAPSTAIGPHCGLRKGTLSSSLGLSLSLLILPSKASCVSATTTSPGLMRSTGSA